MIRRKTNLRSNYVCVLFFAENLQVDRHCSALLLQRIFLLDVRRRAAHVSQAQREEEYRHWQNVFLLLHGVG